jgi:glycosyltransferase involved in cell wall biosynthesis
MKPSDSYAAGSTGSVAVRSRRILLVSYYFPPDAAVGGLRVAKFARSLPDFGWEPYVLTVDDKYRDQGLDPGRLKGLEHVTIVKTRKLPSLLAVYAALKARTKGRTGAPHSAERMPSRRRETFGQRLKRYVISLIVLLPDQEKTWAICAAAKAILMIRRHHISHILTSAPPLSINCVGLVAKAFTKVEWIADFRDPWLEAVFDRAAESRSKLSDAIERRMERAVITYADKIITTNARMTAALRERYPSVAADKFICVTNGIDSDRIQVGADVKKYDTFTITYAGTFYFDRTPEPLFRAVRDLLKSGEVSPAEITIKLVGNCQFIEGRATADVAAEYGLASVVEVLDAVPYSEAIAIMQRSHLLLNIAPKRHRLVVGAKLFDYLGSGSRVLCIAEDGATADFMRDSNCGTCFSESDVEGLRHYLGDLLKGGRFKHLKNDVGSFQRYDFRYLTGRLVAEIGGPAESPLVPGTIVRT